MGYYLVHDRIDLKNRETKRGELKVLTGPRMLFNNNIAVLLVH